ncbi:RimJ/RimL family protein N-acetyltransferase [Bacillus mesophilus]|uniref:GNAT family N-acetyltransferase n=1 Tax=Bacillus mesophilus TaxID=1808955 RepID=A0A6M0QB47_9BACI|nr:GNAT family N-acetyltransferase [Bacillus mesophilus]MBM7662957.1 RimJ/RimL family protein N-acetyltransferase [Bacillus mesophilus]NEY73545.1 GNAT family N-acetyltransferase [Bacillus mesophilus]
MTNKIPVLVGELVRLRPINDADHLSWFEVEQDESMHKWVGNAVPTSLDEVKHALYELYPQHFMLWMIEEKTSGKVIGMMRISHPEQRGNQLVAGDSQRLHSDYWRKGYMRESRKLIYDYVFNTLKIDVLYADVWEGNVNSIKSLVSAGYKLIDCRKEYFKKYNKTQNKLYYELREATWKR